MRTLIPLGLSLGMLVAGGPADAQQPTVEMLQQQAITAAQAQGSDNEAAQKQFQEAVEKARLEMDTSRPAEKPAATTTSDRPPAQPTSPTSQLSQVQSGYGGAGSGGRGPTMPTETPTSAMSSPPTSSAPPASTPHGAKAPFAHEYFARFEPRLRQAQPQQERLGLRGAIPTDALVRVEDDDLDQELRRLEKGDRKPTGPSAGGKAARSRLPFIEPGTQQIASSQKTRRPPMQNFEELN